MRENRLDLLKTYLNDFSERFSDLLKNEIDKLGLDTDNYAYEVEEKQD